MRRSLLWSLERQARAGRVTDVDGDLMERLVQLVRKDKQPAVRAHAWLALGALAPERALALRPELTGKLLPVNHQNAFQLSLLQQSA